MQKTNLVDEFFNNQPQKTFEKDLREFFVPTIFFEKKNSNKDLIEIKSIFIRENEVAKEQLLIKAFENFSRFVKKNNLCGFQYPIDIKIKDGFEFEEYEIDIDKDCCKICASDIEGIRRAIIEVEDLLIFYGGYLKAQKIRKKQLIKSRIGRCYFAPINRPPKNRAELDDEIDYYPDAYLDRLMRDDINVIWVYSDLEALVQSSYIVEFGKDREKRINKLNSIIEKCAQYGIKVYLFLIAPMSLDEGTINNKYPNIAKTYPQVKGNFDRGPAGFCISTEFGKNFLQEAITNLVKSCSNLGGIISITFGERVTHCGNTWGDLEGKWENNCPHCKGKSRMEIVCETSKIISDSIKKVNPNMDFISWTYGLRGQSADSVIEYVDKCDKDIIMLQNFEDDGRIYQLGKKRFALDYYLCYKGPSDMFKLMAERAKINKKQIYAKMQVCCSHELATVPYIPVPGIIYDKVKRAKENGVTGIMESWLFGNYPCLMSKCVGLLKSDEEISKKEFLIKLARLYYKNENAEKVAKAWELFEKAYSNYPVNVMFNYYGPMHDGVVWKLALKPKNYPLPRTWQLQDTKDGDRIGECLFRGHSIDEAISLCDKISKEWDKGLKILNNIEEENEQYAEQLSVAKALSILFKSGLNILNFYNLRDEIGYQKGNALEKLSSMKEIVKSEIENSKKMIDLCLKDNRLGYHSESEGYKFFVENLLDRINYLQDLLKTEFVEIENNIINEKIPLDYYVGNDDSTKSIIAGRNGFEDAEWAYLDDDNSRFRISIGEMIEIEIESKNKQDFFLVSEFHLMFPETTLIAKHDGKIGLFVEDSMHSILDEKREEELSKWKIENLSTNENTHLIVKIAKNDSNFIRLPYKFMIKTTKDASWARDKNGTYSLGKCLMSPNDFGWIK